MFCFRTDNQLRRYAYKITYIDMYCTYMIIIVSNSMNIFAYNFTVIFMIILVCKINVQSRKTGGLLIFVVH